MRLSLKNLKGTGNMELQLDRKIANKRIFSTIDLTSSSTRRDDMLLDQNVAENVDYEENTFLI
jgi:transcription termination factor Rho